MAEIKKKTVVTETTEQVPDVVEETTVIHHPPIIQQPTVVQPTVVQQPVVVREEVVEDDGENVSEKIEELADGDSLAG